MVLETLSVYFFHHKTLCTAMLYTYVFWLKDATTHLFHFTGTSTFHIRDTVLQTNDYSILCYFNCYILFLLYLSISTLWYIYLRALVIYTCVLCFHFFIFLRILFVLFVLLFSILQLSIPFFSPLHILNGPVPVAVFFFSCFYLDVGIEIHL